MNKKLAQIIKLTIVIAVLFFGIQQTALANRQDEICAEKEGHTELTRLCNELTTIRKLMDEYNNASTWDKWRSLGDIKNLSDARRTLDVAIVAEALRLASQDSKVSEAERVQLRNDLDKANSMVGVPSIAEADRATPEGNPACVEFTDLGIPTAVNLRICVLGALQVVATFFERISSWVASVANVVFSLALFISVRGFANFANMEGVTVGWKIIRDLMNLLFIGSLFYIAIGTILQVSSANWKNTLPKIIMAALLINFSMVFTRVMIDSSNIITLAFYDKSSTGMVKWPGTDTPITFPVGTEKVTVPDVATEIFQIMNPNKIENNPLSGDDAISRILMASLGKITLQLVTAYVLAVGAILFIIRAIVLIFLLISSPLAFVGLIMPKFGSQSDQWWKTLTDQLIFAPVYMACFFVVIKIAHGTQRVQDAIGRETMFGAMTLMFFIILNGLMLGCIFVAKSMGAKGATFAQQTAGSMLAGIPAKIGQNTLGRWNAFDAKNARAKAQDQSLSAEERSKWAAKAVKFEDKAKRNYDVRNTKPVQALGKVSGADFGKGSTTSFGKKQEEKAKKEKEYTDRLSKTMSPQTDLEKEEAKAKVEDENKAIISGEGVIIKGEKVSLPEIQDKLAGLDEKIATNKRTVEEAPENKLEQARRQSEVNQTKTDFQTAKLELDEAIKKQIKEIELELESKVSKGKATAQDKVEAKNKTDKLKAGEFDDLAWEGITRTPEERAAIQDLKAKQATVKTKETNYTSAETNLKAHLTRIASDVAARNETELKDKQRLQESLSIRGIDYMTDDQRSEKSKTKEGKDELDKHDKTLEGNKKKLISGDHNREEIANAMKKQAEKGLARKAYEATVYGTVDRVKDVGRVVASPFVATYDSYNDIGREQLARAATVRAKVGGKTNAEKVMEEAEKSIREQQKAAEQTEEKPEKPTNS